MARFVLSSSIELENFLADRKIYMGVRSGWGRRAVSIAVDDSIEIEPYVGFYAGGALATAGCFTYSQSVLPTGMKIGRFCSIGEGVRVQKSVPDTGCLTTSNFAYERGGPVYAAAGRDSALADPCSRSHVWRRVPSIGNDVWVGRDVLLFRETTVGDGAIVMDGSVVVDDVPPFCVVRGNPAQIVDVRFDVALTDRIRRAPWWSLPPHLISGLPLRDALACVEQVEEFMESGVAEYRPDRLLGSDLRVFAA